jgi:hypothetical protein
MRRTDLLSEIGKYVGNAALRLDPMRYAQESAYVDAFIGRLDGIIPLGNGNGTIDLRATIVADRGPGAAEKKYGADFCLVFESKNIPVQIKKAVIAQAKKGTIESLSKNEINRLEIQCTKMAKFTANYLILETPDTAGKIPNIRIGNPINQTWQQHQIPFHEYLVDYIISCSHGDKREIFIDALSESSLTKLTVNTDGLTYEPDPPSNGSSLSFDF